MSCDNVAYVAVVSLVCLNTLHSHYHTVVSSMMQAAAFMHAFVIVYLCT